MTKLAAIRASASVLDGSAQAADLTLTADVCVIGSGAGGAVAASVLSAAGRSVLIVEEGGYYTAEADFDMQERHVLPKLYQEAMLRATADGAISILQGRAVGGTTVVNWTTSFRTPEHVVDHWKRQHHVGGLAYADLVPHYEAIESRLGIHRVPEEEMNANNRRLFEGCKAKGWKAETLRRNVYRCQQTGMCGQGCPVNAKRSMLVTLIPDAIDSGARLLFRCRVDRLVREGAAITTAEATLLDAEGTRPTGKRVTIRAKHFIVAGGAINSPALLLRSGLNDNQQVGRRTFIHPAIGVAGLYAEPIHAESGAPQSVASHEFAHRGTDMGMFLEAAPFYPVTGAIITPGFGADHAAAMKKHAHRTSHVAILIDGFHEGDDGGVVKLRPSGAPVLDYPLTSRLWEAIRFGHKQLAEINFAAGAKSVLTVHDPPIEIQTPQQIGTLLDGASWRAQTVPIFTAHQMGGCAMGDDAKTSVVRSADLRHHELQNLYVMDGSVFPTSLGVNPQESIYGLVRLMATRLADAKPAAGLASTPFA